MADPHPEFPACIASRVGNAALELLRANAALAAYFATGDGIQDAESEVVAVDAGSRNAPALIVTLGPGTERRTGNDSYTQAGTALDLWMFTPVELRLGSEGWLRARLVDAIKKTIVSQAGVLYDAVGEPITEAYLEFDRIDFRGRVRGKNVLVTPMRVTLFTDFHQITREPL